MFISKVLTELVYGVYTDELTILENKAGKSKF